MSFKAANDFFITNCSITFIGKGLFQIQTKYCKNNTFHKNKILYTCRHESVRDLSKTIKQKLEKYALISDSK